MYERLTKYAGMLADSDAPVARFEVHVVRRWLAGVPLMVKMAAI